MLARTHWNVLIVDDEPDIHEVTDLLLKKEEVFGRKLKLHHANSAKEAIALLEGNTPVMRTLAAALVDVVMETDHAGLDFCKYIREEKRRVSTALVLRTGQPGQAPPRQIIDEYNISNYLTKVEATRDRLYMILKLGIQQYYELSVTQNRNWVMDQLRANATSPADMLGRFQRVLDGTTSLDGVEMHAAHDFFGKFYAGAGAFKEQSSYLAIKDDLLAKAQGQLQAPARPGDATPGLMARVDEYSIIQTRVLGTDKLATMVFKDAVYPRELLWFYGPMWRQSLAYLAEVLARA